jgi:rhamnulokinase
VGNAVGNHAVYLAIDLGASNGRLIAGTISDQRLKLTEVGRFQTPLDRDPTSGYQCWDIDEIVAQSCKAIDESRNLGCIRSVGVDSWGVDYVLLDEQMQRVGKAVCYRDKRTAGGMERIFASVPAKEIYRRTGVQFQPFNTIYQLAATALQEPKWIDSARHLLMIPDYIHYRLSGVLSNEYTNATTTQLLNLDGTWDRTLLEAAGLNRLLMLPPIEAGTVLGKTKVGSDWAQVIAPATHDTASAVAGTPLEGPDEAYISSGTWSLMGIESKTPIATSDAMRMNFANEGGFERRYRVLKNITGMWPLQRLCQEHNHVANDALVTEAQAVPGWRTILNPDDQRFLNPPSMTDAIRDYCKRTRQPEPETIAQFARCVFDSLALSYRNVKEQLETLRQRKLTRIRILGGGCRNRLLNQLCANACQLPVSAGPVEASALGNLCAQMIGLGEIEDLDAARSLIRASFQPEEFEPEQDVPDNVWQRFQELLHADPTETKCK